jgi:hypothetical protein
MSTWLQLQGESWCAGNSAPRAIERHSLDSALVRLRELGATVSLLDVGAATSAWDVVVSVKQVLPLPDWCGAGWDSIDDAFEELRQGLSFPTAVVVTGVARLLDAHLRVGLETVVRLSELERAFSIAGDQFLVFYVGGD